MAQTNEWMRQAVREDPASPPAVDIDKASIARVYDYMLGGKDNYPADREAAQLTIKALPDTPQIAFDNRAFLQRAVRYLVGEAGIKQIIDIGSGLPTAGNVHEIAQEVDPAARVVYVDNDPIVLAHGRALLSENDSTTVITADLRDPDTIFDHPDTQKLINWDEPFAILLGGIVHHFSDEQDPQALVAALRDRLPSGGYLLVTNFYDSGEPRARELERAFLEGLGAGRFRTREEQVPYFDGLELVEPGLVLANEWRPDSDTPTASPVHTLYIGAVGRKP